MQLFYTPAISDTSKTITFNKDESKHIIKVLRKSIGDTVHVTNGKGAMFTTVITQANPNKCIAEIKESAAQPKRNYTLHLVVAPTKMNDRYEWFLEKATEIGIDEITPIICDHSERKKIKPDRYERVLQSAMKQSLHYRLPVLNKAISFNEFIEQSHHGSLYIAHCEAQEEKKSLKSELLPKQNYTILIGPEGDFSPSEIKAALNHKFMPVSLGESRLRTETAAIVACHTVALINEP